MKIVYLHGFNSAGDPSSDKVLSLSSIAQVWTPSYDTFAEPDAIEDFLLNYVQTKNPDLIMGCSLCGYWACRIAYIP
jgi:predicted esterase YcpF (UPF0227 family)